MMTNGKDQDPEIIVYEPIRRGENDDEYKNRLKSSTQYSGLYNRGNQSQKLKQREYMLFKLAFTNSIYDSGVPE